MNTFKRRKKAIDVSADSLIFKHITSLAGYVTAIKEYHIQDGCSIWYRGISRQSHLLVPSLFRSQINQTKHDFISIEAKLNRRFRDKSLPYLAASRDEASDTTALQSWWRLFTMQHYGMPTRLLDWSENAMTALCFSIFGAVAHSDIDEHAVVWLLDPGQWNKTGNTNIARPQSVDEHDVKVYSPIPQADRMVEDVVWPLAIFGMHNSPRISIQQGAFVVFAPGISKGMESHIKELSNFKIEQSILRSIIIDKDAIKEIFLDLKRLGYTQSGLYPDLEGLSADIKKEFGY